MIIQHIHSIHNPRTRYSDHPAGCVNQSEVSVVPAGWFNRWFFDSYTLFMHPHTRYSDHPAGCVNQSEVSVVPAGWFNRWLFNTYTLFMHPHTRYSDHPAGCVNQSEVSVVPAGWFNDDYSTHTLYSCTHTRDTVIILQGVWTSQK